MTKVQRKTVKPSPAETPVTDFGFSDVLALPEPEVQEVTRVFEARGKKWPITISNVGVVSAEDFFAIATEMRELKKAGTVRITLPGGKKVVIDNLAYLSALGVLTRVAVKPKFNRDEWAVFGHKVGAAMNDILMWAAEVNGLSEEVQQEELEQAKNDLSADGSTTSSSAPA